MTDYGTKIAELRSANKMTQAQLGEQLNVTSQAVSKWENGLSEPDIESIRKICEIFHITFDEFFGAETAKQDSEEESTQEKKSQEAPSVILAYCDTCDKPLYNPKEYQVTIENGVQHTTCMECVPKKAAAKQKAAAKAREQKRAAQKAENRRELRKGMLWGILGGVVLAVLALIGGIFAEQPAWLIAIGTLLGAYGGFAMLTQLIWVNSVWDVFCFFLKTVKWPGVIFTLDLDGIFFLIFVKILFAVLGAIIGVLLFIVGFFVTWAYAMIIFPFALIKELREL
ncbi:MAG: helix-turn-helix transcriptional regulator [Clostridiales bacterium]|nr:helix-turn-helix transcriptional regulator [Clostridiales bacterium]